MQKPKKTFLLRKVLIGTVIAIFTYLSIVFVLQYITYQKVKERLDAAYAFGLQQPSIFYNLFSVYGEADNLFRKYTIDFKPETYKEYKGKLDTIRFYIDSLSALSNSQEILQQSTEDIENRSLLAGEFASLKRTVDDLVFMAQDSLPVLETSRTAGVAKPSYISADSVVNKILNDTVLNVVDTVVRAKGGLLKRIFNTKSDTLLTNTQQFNIQQIEALQRNVSQVFVQNETIYNRSFSRLQDNFKSLRQKERALIQANYLLLNNLKTGVDNIRELERQTIRDAEAQDLLIYKENTKRLRNQLVISLSVMAFMILFILYYQSIASKYEKKLVQEKDYASKVAEEKTSVLANISHEVRAPINSLLGIIDILRKKGTKHSVEPEYLDSAAHEISVINNTVNDILNLSKLEVGALDVKNEYCSPYLLLSDIILLHRYQAQKKKLSFEQDITIDPKLEIYSSAFRLRQIISNLISNAIKYTPHGEVSVRAYTKKKNEHDTLVVEVKDTGLGIAPEYQTQIFRQYYMADNKAKTKGFGLGLYISKLLSEQLQGDITLKSSVGKGSTFTLFVPIKQQRQKESVPKVYSLADLPRETKLLLVDDNRINILYLKHYFKDFPHVNAFEKAEEALAHIRQHPVDVVITDMMMPDVNGWDVLQAIRDDDTKRNIKVFAFTADTMHLEEEMKKKPRHQFDFILSKPLDEHHLVACILED